MGSVKQDKKAKSKKRKTAAWHSYWAGQREAGIPFPRWPGLEGFTRHTPKLLQRHFLLQATQSKMSRHQTEIGRREDTQLIRNVSRCSALRRQRSEFKAYPAGRTPVKPRPSAETYELRAPKSKGYELGADSR